MAGGRVGQRGGSPGKRLYPGAAAAPQNILTVSSENCPSSLPSPPSLAKRSCVIVMMWQPTASACTRFSTSRGDAQMHSELGAAAMIEIASDMSGIGSTPVSAILPAKIDWYDAAPSFTASVIAS